MLKNCVERLQTIGLFADKFILHTIEPAFESTHSPVEATKTWYTQWNELLESACRSNHRHLNQSKIWQTYFQLDTVCVECFLPFRAYACRMRILRNLTLHVSLEPLKCSVDILRELGQSPVVRIAVALLVAAPAATTRGCPAWVP